MPAPCEACGASNRTNAMFCIGCTAKLPGFVASGPSVLETLRVSAPVARAVRQVESRGGGTSGLAPVLTLLLGLALVALALTLGLAIWWVAAQVPALRHARSATLDMPDTVREDGATSAVSAAASAVAPPAPPVSKALATLPHPVTPRPELNADVVAPRAISEQPGPADANAAERALATASAIATISPTTGAPRSVALAAGDTPAQVVTKFYRALAAGDGETAAAIVIPSKRGRGPFNGEAMTKFYRSFRYPLTIRSIRQIDAHVVEARYSYQASSAECRALAIVETEQVQKQTLIRRIRANC